MSVRFPLCSDSSADSHIREIICHKKPRLANVYRRKRCKYPFADLLTFKIFVHVASTARRKGVDSAQAYVDTGRKDIGEYVRLLPDT
ncbi:hypothetical protein LB506_000439 [Fusarium annulatum]|nr:hypothetical protein LB506_000439 [Fusarium annulatum]